MSAFPRVAALAAAMLLAACDNAEQRANALFVDASSAATQASIERDIFKKFDLLTSADAKVSALLADYPTSGPAVRIAANEPIGAYTRPALQKAIAELSTHPRLCSLNPTQHCYLDIVATALEQVGQGQDSGPGTPLFATAVTGWPYLAYLDPDREKAIFASFKDAAKFRAMFIRHITQNGLAPFITDLVAAGRVDDAANFLKSLAQQGFRAELFYTARAIADALPQNRTLNTNRIAARLMASIADPLPAEIAEQIATSLCEYRYRPEDIPLLIDGCGAEAFVNANPSPPSDIPEDTREALYAAATSDKKQSVAASFYSSAKELPPRLTWAERAGYMTNPEKLSALYFTAAKENHPARAQLAAKLHAVPDPEPKTAVGAAGVTERTIFLLHDTGALKAQLPTVYQVLKANPQYTYELERALSALLLVHDLDTSLPLEPLTDSLRDVVATWPEKNDASRSMLTNLFIARIATRDVDPKPFLDRFYKGKPYISQLWPRTILRLRAYGHEDLYQSAISQSKPASALDGLAFQLLMQELEDDIEQGRSADVLSKLAQQHDKLRSATISRLLSPLPRHTPARTAFISKLTEIYPLLIATTRVRSLSDRTDEEGTARVFLDNYDAVISQVGDTGWQWLLRVYPRVSTETQLKIIQTLGRHDVPAWILVVGGYLLKTASAGNGKGQGALEVGQGFAKGSE